ncbi:MAG: IS630 family transposase [Patescibacteria group bacterium]
MWCIPKVDRQFIQRMEDVLDLYEKQYDQKEPILCFDEKSIQLLEHTRAMILSKKGRSRKVDYEYKRNGTANIFVTVDPKAGFRTKRITKRRTKTDFAKEIERIVNIPRYKGAKRIHIVLDNLNTHSKKSIRETFDKEKGAEILSRIKFHYTPKHASWLNMAEIEIGILSRQCLKQRIATEKDMRKQVSAWQRERNRRRMKIQWRWTKKDARKVFHYRPQVLNE